MSEPSYGLGNFEEIVLMAVSHLGVNRAYGASIRQTVAEATGRNVSIGAIYLTLDRLERKGYLRSWHGEATPERGGRAKRYFLLEGAGEEALRVTNEARERLKPRFGKGLEGLKPA